MGATGEMPNIGGLSTTSDIDTALIARRSADDDPAKDAPAKKPTASSLAKGDQGTSAFAHATCEPIMSFEWGNLKQVTAIGQPVAAAGDSEVAAGVPDVHAAVCGPGTPKPKLQVAAPVEVSLGGTGKFTGTQLKGATTLVFSGPGISSVEAGPLNASAKRLIRNAETLLRQLSDVERFDVTATVGLTRLRAAVDAIQAFPGEPKTWEGLYRAMLGLRSTLQVASSGQSQAMAAAAEAFAAIPFQVEELLASLHLPNVKALQARLEVPQTGVIDGQTFLALELMLLEADAVDAGGMNGAAATVANSQVNGLMGQASLLRDLRGTDLMTALKQGKLSEEAQWYLNAHGYMVDGQQLIDNATGKAVTAADPPALGSKLVKDATDTLLYDVGVLNQDEKVHLKALSPEQQEYYKMSRKALDGILSQVAPDSAGDAVAQLFVSQQFGIDFQTTATAVATVAFATTKGILADGPAPQPLVMDKATLVRWRTTGMTPAELDRVPAPLRQGLEKFLAPTAGGLYVLKMTEAEMNQVLDMMAFVQKPPAAAKQLMASFHRTAKQARAVRELSHVLRPDLPPMRLSQDDLRSLAKALQTLAIPQTLTMSVPELRILPTRGRARRTLRSGGAAWGPQIRATTGMRRMTAGGLRPAEADGSLPTAVHTGSTAAKSQPGPQPGHAAQGLIKDEQEYTARMSAKRFAQQIRNQQGLDKAQQAREAYKASLLRQDGTGATAEPPPPPSPAATGLPQ
jgi:hypothetical protein